MQVNIDRFDLLNWMNGCAIGSHLRQGIWQRAVDEFYDKLTPDERTTVYTYAKRDFTEIFEPKLLPDGSSYQHFGHEDFYHFLACYNPANRYLVRIKRRVDGKTVDETIEAYKWNGEYHVGFSRFCAPEYIKEVKPCDFTRCGLVCKLQERCAVPSQQQQAVQPVLRLVHRQGH